MRGRAGDDFECARVSQFAENREQITFPLIDKETTILREQLEVKLCEFTKLRMITVPLLFARSEVDQPIQMLHITFAQKQILKHRAQRWRQGHREFERHRVVHQTLHHAQQGDVTLRDRLEEPVFFEEVLMLRMPNERKMSVKNKREVAHTQTGNRKLETGK